MTALDEFTRATPTFWQASRHAYHEGSGLQVMPGRKLSGRGWAILCGSLAAVIFAMVVR